MPLRVPYRLLRILPLGFIKILIRNKSVIRTMKAEELRIEELSRYENVSVISPHPDDESLGCGGVIAALVEAGCSVSVVFVCNGNGSHPNSRVFPPDALAELRRCEALAAVATLGVAEEDVIFLNCADGAAPFPTDPKFEQIVHIFQRVIETKTIDLCFIPWRRDSSRDHRAVWHIAHASLKLARQSPRILEYPIWVYENNNDAPKLEEMAVRKIDIKKWMAVKTRAVHCHRSQLGKTISDDPMCFKLERPFLANFAYGTEIFFEDL